MSWKVLSQVYERQVGSVLRKAVMTYCADKASDDGRGIWASKGTIAAELEAGRSSVIRTFNELVSEGLLIPEGKRGCQNGATIEYRIDLKALSDLPEVGKPNTKPVPEAHQSQSETGVQVDQSHDETGPGASANQSRSGTQTSLEPPLGRGSAREVDRFQDFWDAYPHRGGNKRKRKDAEAKWSRLRKAGVSQQDIIEGAKRAHSDPEVQRGYARDPTSWLNQEGWKDEIEHSPQHLKAIPGGRNARRQQQESPLDHLQHGLRSGAVHAPTDRGNPFARGSGGG